MEITRETFERLAAHPDLRTDPLPEDDSTYSRIWALEKWGTWVCDYALEESTLTTDGGFDTWDPVEFPDWPGSGWEVGITCEDALRGWFTENPLEG